MKQILHRIPFVEVCNEVTNLLGSEPINVSDLTADGLYQLFERNRVKLEWEPVKNWEKFEQGLLDIPSLTFLEIIFKDLTPTGQILVLTDECFKDEMAFVVEADNLGKFINEAYPNTYNMDFFQPLDTVFICPKSNIISILHHEGLVANYQKPSNRTTDPKI